MSDPDAQWGRDPEPEVAPNEPDIPSLLAFAAASRGRAWADRLTPTMTAALAAGWTKRHWAREACRLIVADDGDPHEITDATRDPLKKTAAGDGPSDEYRRLRQMAEQRRAAS